MLKGKNTFCRFGFILLFSVIISQEIILKDNSIKEPYQKTALKGQINESSCERTAIKECRDINRRNVQERNQGPSLYGNQWIRNKLNYDIG